MKILFCQDLFVLMLWLVLLEYACLKMRLRQEIGRQLIHIRFGCHPAVSVVVLLYSLSKH